MKYTVGLLFCVGMIFAYTSGLLDGSPTAEGAEVRPDSLFAATRGDLTITVTETGYLKAKNSENLKPEFKRSGTITWLVDEGETVVEDDILVEFDKTDLENDIEDIKNGLIQYEAELEAARASLAIQTRDANASIEKWELQSEIAELNLEKFIEGDAPNERRKFQLETEKAASAYDRALERFEQAPRLRDEGFLTKVQVEEERINLREKEIQSENAERAKELYENYTFKITQAQKEADVKDGKRELENAKESATINKKEAQAKVTSAERQLKGTQDRLAELQDEHDKMTIRAPAPGIVHYGDPARPWYRDQVKVGNSFHRGNTIITLPDLREMQIMVQVHEADIDLIAEEMPVNISIEAVKGEIFDGAITDIASVASSNWSDPTNKTFEVEITMEVIERELRAGITARAEIQIEVLENVLYVPIHAVYAEEGEHFCFVSDGEGLTRRAVEIGKNNSHYVSILEGLREGEGVLLYDPRNSGIGTGGDGESSEDGDGVLPGMPTGSDAEA